MSPRGNQPQERVCEANWRRSLCAAKRDPRLRGCTPLRTPIRKSEGPMAKRTQYYCPFLTPSALPPLLTREFPRTPAGGEVEAPLSKGAGRVSGLGDSDGLCVAARYPRRRPGIPPPRLRSAPPFDKGGFAGPYVTARKRSPLSLSQNFTNFTRSTQNLPPLCKTFTAIVPYYGRNRRKTAVQLACFR